MTTEIATIQPTRVTEINRASLSYFVGQRIAEAVLVSGFTVNKQAQDFMLEQVPKDIQTRFPLLELPEIKKAFDDGVRGLYGEYFGISVLTINKWLKSYMDSGAHQEYIASKVKELKLLLPEKTKPTDEEIDEMIRSGLADCFETYKATGKAIDYGSVRIDYLLRKKIIIPSKEEREEYKQQAREMLLSDANAKRESINRIERNEANLELTELLQADDKNAKIQTLAKNLCLMEFFEDLIINNKSIVDCI